MALLCDPEEEIRKSANEFCQKIYDVDPQNFIIRLG
jgi:hypothetical protein